MYVGERHTVTQTLRTLRSYRCASCGFASKALVVGVGQGQGASPYFLDADGAKQRARSGAASAAEENVELTLSLKPCPKCGQRAPGAARAFWAKAILGSAGASAFIWGIGWIVGTLDRHGSAELIFGGVGLFTGPLMYYLLFHWKWTTADQRVAFVSDAEAAKLEKVLSDSADR